jgi:hypothetical protein
MEKGITFVGLDAHKVAINPGIFPRFRRPVLRDPAHRDSASLKDLTLETLHWRTVALKTPSTTAGS